MVYSIVGRIGLAFAEGRCPPGMFESDSRDYTACAPIPYGQGNNDSAEDSPPPIPTVWETQWGAIATESNGGGGSGAISSFKSEAAARQAAVEQCRVTASVSNTKCEVLITYNN